MINRRTNHSRSTVLRGLPVACALALAFASIPLVVGVVDAAESPPGLAGVVNLNTASTGELQLLPGVGEVRAVAIVEIRKERGGFKRVEDLLEVKGIGDAMLERLRPYVTLKGKTTAQKL